MKNLLQETIEILKRHGLTTNDVRWAGSSDGSLAIAWSEFAKIANVSYDAGFGGAEISQDLVIVGDDWWLERHEYDGSEWWEFKKLPARQSNAQPFAKVRVRWSSDTLAECQKEKDYY